MTKPRVVLADDHRIILDGLRRVLADHVTIVATCSDGESLLQAVRSLQPDVVVTDMSMPRLNGINAIREMQRDASNVRTIVLTMYTDETLVKSAILAGADGYIPKHAAGEELVEAIERVVAGGTYISPLIGGRRRPTPSPIAPHAMVQLSRRQREVLRLVAEGKRMKEIAAALNLSARTVEMHKYTTMRALNVKTTAELIQYYVKNELATGVTQVDGTTPPEPR